MLKDVVFPSERIVLRGGVVAEGSERVVTAESDTQELNGRLFDPPFRQLGDKCRVLAIVFPEESYLGGPLPSQFLDPPLLYPTGVLKL